MAVKSPNRLIFGGAARGPSDEGSLGAAPGGRGGAMKRNAGADLGRSHARRGHQQTVMTEDRRLENCAVREAGAFSGSAAPFLIP